MVEAEAEGTIMAEETLRAMNEIPHFSSSAVIKGSSKDVICPGRRRTNNTREGIERTLRGWDAGQGDYTYFTCRPDLDLSRTARLQSPSGSLPIPLSGSSLPPQGECSSHRLPVDLGLGCALL